MTEENGLESLELPSLHRTASVRPKAKLVTSGLHGHHGNTWCHFGLTEGGRTAIDLRSGDAVWALPEPAGYGLTVFDGATAYSAFGGVAAYDLATGNRIWANDLPSLSSRPRVAFGKVYVASTDGIVQVMDAVTGGVVALYRFDYEPSGIGFEPSPVVPLGERWIAIGTRREIICLEIS